ncbi:efflux RND transporter permease subunit [Actinorugispora endophytica]|uniref:HAE1 family hydrophobic/amphiphilic exporter-1 n=1 Tax=Actinorugispora endophytica TaxID=1605990 RepID=A0A4R6UPS8_9ACTN|nr:efflux RND transporter permease subunit [Actinorugispora endophytica]TDQ49230.1 HAE1 family hydrophobic/amphiphilic exporter-1 [Actinorugispora endophytica]
MSRLAKLSLGNRALILLITLSAIIFGLVAAGSMKRELMPSIELPMAVVGAQYQGASPEVVETEITQPLEQAVKGVPGVTGYTSTSSTGSAQVVVEFDYGDSTDDVIRSLQQAVDQVGPMLPEDVDPFVQAFSFDDFPVVMLAAGAGDGDAQALAEPLQEQLVPELESISGVRGVQVTGVRESTVTITPDEGELEDAGYTVNDLTSALQASGRLSPGGQITEDGSTLTVTTGGKLESVEDVENIWLAPGGAPAQAVPGMPAQTSDPVRLSEVADVELRVDDVTSITRTDGEPSLGVSITKTPEGNTVEISEAVRDRVDELEEQLGTDTNITVVFDQAPFINESILAMAEEGLLGLGFAVVIILVFLLSIRSTIVTAVSIPVSLLIALLGMQGFGYTLNILTLGALTVAVGRVVDDSIVVLENIKRHMGYGEDKYTAVFTGVREVAVAITSATLTTIAVFLPVGFVGGQIGEIFRPFAVTVSIALAASLVVSLTIIPVLAYWFMRPRVVPAEELERIKAEENERELRSPLQRAYLPVIRWATRYRLVTLAASVAVLLGTFAMYPYLNTSFLDDQGQNSLTVTQELPVGTSLEEADEEAAKVEEKLAGLSWIESYQASFGGNDPAAAMLGGGGASSVSYTITTDPDGDQAEYQEKLRQALAEVDTESEARVQSAAGMGGTSLSVEVRADDPEVLEEATGLVEEAVRDIPGAADVQNSVAAAQSALEVRVDGEKAAEEGLTEGQIGQAVTAAFQGTTVGTATVDSVQRDMVLRVDEAPASVEALENLEIAAPSGEVELSEVADVEEVQQAPELSRSGGFSSATVSATPTAEDLGQVTVDLTAAMDELDLPEGATASIGGVSEDQNEAFAQMGLAMLVAVAIVYLVMVATFKSLMQPLVLLVSIPFAATGALGLLLVTGVSLSLPALIGMLMLIGVVVTNAIVLIDLINQYREEGMELREAVVEGSRHRLRPILMTALATIGALTPMALGITGGGAFISQPLAIVVIGGLVSSTLLTLILVPVLYTMTEGVKERRGKRRAAEREAAIAEARAEAADAKKAESLEDASS